MLWQRVLTALVIGPLILWALFGASPLVFQYIVGAVVLIGAWEWSGLSKLTPIFLRIIYVLLTLAIIIICQYLSFSALYIIYWGVIAWFLAIIVLYRFSQNKKVLFNLQLSQLLMGLMVLIPFAVSLFYLNTTVHHDSNILLLLLIIASFDTGAYFVGKRFGKHKLAPSISPGKSIEGVIGGVIFSLIVVAIFSIVMQYSWQKTLVLLIIGMFTALISIVGDLFESAIKRHAGVKDSGKILPGHGGILDRIDSYTAGAPFFALALFLSQGFY